MIADNYVSKKNHDFLRGPGNMSRAYNSLENVRIFVLLDYREHLNVKLGRQRSQMLWL